MKLLNKLGVVMTFVPSYSCITSLIVLFDLIYMAYYQFVLISKCKIIVFFLRFNPILLKLFRAIDSSTAGLQKPTNLTIHNSKTT